MAVIDFTPEPNKKKQTLRFDFSFPWLFYFILGRKRRKLKLKRKWNERLEDHNSEMKLMKHFNIYKTFRELFLDYSFWIEITNLWLKEREREREEIYEPSSYAWLDCIINFHTSKRDEIQHNLDETTVEQVFIPRTLWLFKWSFESQFSKCARKCFKLNSNTN